MLSSYVELSRQSIDFAGTGDNIVVPLVEGQRGQVYKLFFVVSAATTIRFKSAAANLTGPVGLSAGATVTLDFDQEPWFVTGEGEDFVINQTGTAQVSGMIAFRYAEK